MDVDLSARARSGASAIQRGRLPGRYRRDRDGRPGPLAWACRRKQRLQGAGVSACATCDGFFYRGKTVCRHRRREHRGGGGALPHAPRGPKVTLIHRRDSLRAEKILQRRLFDHPEDRGGVGQRGRGGARRRPARGGDRACGCGTCGRVAIDRRWPVDGVFIAIGHSPNTERVSRDRWRWTTKDTCRPSPGLTQTSVPGVFAAGDVQDKHWRQAITAAGHRVHGGARGGALPDPERSQAARP